MDVFVASQVCGRQLFGLVAETKTVFWEYILQSLEQAILCS